MNALEEQRAALSGAAARLRQASRDLGEQAALMAELNIEVPNSYMSHATPR